MTDQQNNGAADDNSPQFSLQRIYVRDLSFEAPKSPQIFRQQWEPSVSLDLNTRQKALESDFHEVVLTLSVTVKNGEEVAFIAEVQQAGIFLIKNLDAASMSHTLGAFCPNILFPYARETLDSLVTRGSFPALMLSRSTSTPCTRRKCSACRKPAKRRPCSNRCKARATSVALLSVSSRFAGLPRTGWASTAGKALLAPRLVDGYRHGVGQVQAAAAGPHGQAQALLRRQAVQHLGGQAPALGAEQEGIARLVIDLVEGMRAFGGKGEQSRLAEALQAVSQALVALERGILVVIQPCPAQALVVQLEAQRLDQV